MVKVCLKYNTGFINFVCIILSVSIVIAVSFGVEKIQAKMLKNNEEKSIILNEENSKKIDNKIEKNIIEEVENKVNNNIDNNQSKPIDGKNQVEEVVKSNEFDWYIEIPKIKLYAPIEEGTEDEILNRSVGHFDNTSIKNGNCGLAAHNRGYRVNYFANVKELEIGDTIFYFVDGKKYSYKVTSKDIIYETDWSNLNETKDSRITLITCVENREEYRLCVQATLNEKEE